MPFEIQPCSDLVIKQWKQEKETVFAPFLDHVRQIFEKVCIWKLLPDFVRRRSEREAATNRSVDFSPDAGESLYSENACVALCD